MGEAVKPEKVVFELLSCAIIELEPPLKIYRQPLNADP